MRKLIPAVFAFFVAGACQALGFGDLSLDSALNQPFEASVQLLAVKPSERDTVRVSVASPETYRRFGVVRSPVVDDLKVTVRPVAGSDRVRVRLASRRPVREPFVTLLLEANWDGGRALREYTVLLDPPVSEPTAASAEAAPAPKETQARPAADQPRAERAPAPAAEPAASAPRAAADREPGYRRYGPVARNETLWSIAYELRPDPRISMDQMQLAIFRSNPQAFEGNINRLQAGTMLIVPSADEIRAVDPALAKREIAAQKRAHRAGGEPAKPEPTRTARAPEPSGEAPPPEEGELRLEPASEEPGEASEAAPETGADRPAAEEPDATAAKAAEQESPSAGAGQAEASAEEAPAAEAAAAPGDDEATAVADGGEAAADGDDKVAQDMTAGSDAGQPGAATSAEDRGREAETATRAEFEDATATAAPATTPAQGEAEADSESAPAEDAGPMAEAEGGDAVPLGAESVVPEGSAGLLTTRNLLLALATVLLLAMVVMWLRRRQYKPMPADFSSRLESAALEPEDEAETPAEPAPAAAGEAPAATVAELLADADSYVEHELYEEAVAALNVGLEEHPDESALQRKILEVHYRAGARDAFLEAVDRFYPEANENDADWREVAVMGRELAPDEPRFAGVPAAAGIVAATGAAAADSDWMPESGPSADFPESEIDETEWFADQTSTEAPAEPGAATPPAEDETAAEEIEDLDLAFDLGADEAAEFEAGPDLGATPEASPDEESATDAGEEAVREGEAEAESEAAPPSLDIDLSEFDFAEEDAGSAESGTDSGTETAAEGAEDEFADFDLDSLELSLGDEDEGGDEKEGGGEPVTEDEGADSEGAAPGGEIAGDEGTASVEGSGEATGSTQAPSLDVDWQEEESAESGAAADEEAPADDEVTTQLDLARAYLDMGEPEMARGLLEEVKSQGNAEQRREAEELLERAG